MSKVFIKSLSYGFAPFYGQFYQDLQNPQKAQNTLKNKVIKKLNKTAYGSKLKVKNLEDWENIPIVNYETIEPWINQQRQQPKY